MDTRIAVMADQELIDALRLAGVVEVHALAATPENAAFVSAALGRWLTDESLGVIIIGAAHARLAPAGLDAIRRSRRLRPLIVEVPSRDGTWEPDAAVHYQRIGREYLGLEVRLQEHPAPDAVAPGQGQG